MKRKFILRFKFFLSVLFLSTIIFTSCNNLTDAASLEPTDKNEVILESVTAATSASTDENYVTLSGSLSTGGAYPEEIARTLSGEKVTEDSSSRSAFPAVSTTDNSLTYSITVKYGSQTCPGNISTDKKSYTVAIPVQSEAMTCTVEASIFKGTDKLFSGESESFTISRENQVVEVPAITLKALSSGNGSIGLEINVEGSGISYCTVKLDGELISDEDGSEKFEPSSNKITVTKNDVTAKVYLGEFSFYDSSDVLIYSFKEYGINVISNLTTNTWISNADPLEEWFQLTGSGNIATCRITAAMVEGFLLPPEIYVDPNATSSTESGSFFNPCKTFSKAIEKLTDATKDYTIYINGTLSGSGFQIPASLKNDGNGTYNAKSLTLCGARGLDTNGNPQDSLDGNDDGTVLHIFSDVPIVIKNLSIKNGYQDGQGMPAGIWMDAESLILSDGAQLKNNLAADHPGALNVDGIFKLKGSVYIPSGWNGETGYGRNDVYLPTGTTIKIAGKLTPPAACTDGIVATITPASYTAGTQLIELDTGVTDTTLPEASGHFAVTPDASDPSKNWAVDREGKLKVLIGTKLKPDAVGDIVFNDGSAMPYSDYAEAVTDVKNALKPYAIALIFYKGTGLNSGDDTTTVRTLGVGLMHSTSGLVWCTNTANAFSKNITDIQQIVTDGRIFTGDNDGSDNLEQIEAFEGVDDTTGDGAADRYPAFYFAKNYASNTVTNIAAASEFARGWYLPSFAELYQIYANGKSSGKIFDLETASAALGGSKFDNGQYWSASQYAAVDTKGWGQSFIFGDRVDADKNYNFLVCAIREF